MSGGLRNGSSGTAALLLEADSEPLSPDLTTSAIPDLDNMTANELCEDISWTQETLGLMAGTRGDINNLGLIIIYFDLKRKILENVVLTLIIN